MTVQADCISAIREIIDTLTKNLDQPKTMVESVECAKSQLKSLPSECRLQLVDIGRALLGQSPDWQWKDELAFKVVLMVALDEKLPGIIELSIDALRSPNVKSKEDYVEFVNYNPDPRAIPALLNVIHTHASSESEAGYVIAKAINALKRIGADNAASIIIPLICHPADPVRLAAVGFTAARGLKQAVPVLLSRVEDEDDPVVFDRILEILTKWKILEVVPMLRLQLQAGAYSNNEDMIESAKAAIAALE